MRILFFIIAVICFLFAVMANILAKSAIHEILAALCMLGAILSLATYAILKELSENKIKDEEPCQLKSQLKKRRLRKKQ